MPKALGKAAALPVTFYGNSSSNGGGGFTRVYAGRYGVGGGGTEGNGDGDGVAGGEGGKVCRGGFGAMSGGPGGKGGLAQAARGHSAGSPGADGFDGLAGPVVLRMPLLEAREHVLRAVRCPLRQYPLVLFLVVGRGNGPPRSQIVVLDQLASFTLCGLRVCPLLPLKGLLDGREVQGNDPFRRSVQRA